MDHGQERECLGSLAHKIKAYQTDYSGLTYGEYNTNDVEGTTQKLYLMFLCCDIKQYKPSYEYFDKNIAWLLSCTVWNNRGTTTSIAQVVLVEERIRPFFCYS